MINHKYRDFTVDSTIILLILSYNNIPNTLAFGTLHYNTRWFKYDQDWFVCTFVQISPGHIWTNFICETP